MSKEQRSPQETTILRNLFNIKKAFHASTGEAIGSLNDTMTAMLNEIGNEMINMQKMIDSQSKVNTELKKELEDLKKPKKPAKN